MRQVGLYLLGHFEVRLNGSRVESFHSAKKSALLAYLAVESNRPHLRETLAELFWPDRPRGVARANLRQALLVIRQVIRDHEAPSPLLEVTASTVQLSHTSSYLADVVLFEGHFQTIRSHAHENLEMCPSCMSELEAAVGLYRGDFLDSLSINEGASFHEWLQFYRRYYSSQQLEALQHLTNYYQSLKRYEMAYQYALRQVKMDALKESAHRQIMMIFAVTGRRSAAIEQYEICRRGLVDELGIEPEPETTALLQQIRAGKITKNEEDGHSA